MQRTLSPKALKKSELLGEQLKRELATSRLSVGSKFYSVEEVSRRFDVSQATAQKVVAGLVRRGYLRSARGQGYFLKVKPRNGELHPMFKSSAVTQRLVYVNVHTDPPARVFQGMQEACQEHGFRLEVINLDSPNFMESVSEDGVAGLIVCPYHADSRVDSVPKPKISIGHWPRTQDQNVTSFIADAEQAAVDAVRHLCGLRHERIALIAGQDEEGVPDQYVAQLIAGLRRGFKIYGLTWDDDLLCATTTRNAEQVAREFARTYRRRGITAALVANWGSMAALYREFVASGRAFPDDLSVIGYGHHAFQQFIRPSPLTHFDLKMSNIALAAAQALIAYAQNAAPLPLRRYVTFPVELLVGQSTAMRT